MDRKPIPVRREEGRIVVYFPFPEGPAPFYGPRALGDVVISLRKYHAKHGKDIPKPDFEIDLGLDCSPGAEGSILESNVGDLYRFRKG
jgi:hypothetical protein